MWIYQQSSGTLSKDGIAVGAGYSGFGIDRNNPIAEAIPDAGPIPQGQWKIEGPPIDTSEHGPYVLRLYPCADTVTFGRDGFLIHGDSIDHPGEASKGCIVADKRIRTAIWQSGDYDLTVVS